MKKRSKIVSCVLWLVCLLMLFNTTSCHFFAKINADVSLEEVAYLDILFNEGLLAVQEDSGDCKWGFVDKKGKFVIEPTFDKVYNFTANGLARAKKDDAWGFINQKGEVVIGYNYDMVYNFDDDYAYVKVDDKYGAINEKGEYLFVPQYDMCYAFTSSGLALVKHNSRAFFINKKGQNVFGDKTFEDAGAFGENGLARVEVDDKWGFINTDGEFVIEPIYDTALSFEDDSVVGVEKDGKWAYIDAQGNAVCDFVYERVYSIENGLGVFKKDGAYGYMNAQGEEVIRAQYEVCSNFGDNERAFFRVGKKWGVIDKDGEIILQPTYGARENFSLCGLALIQDVRESGKWGYIDGEGKEVIEMQFSQAGSFFADGYAIVKIGDQYGVIDKKGDFVLRPKYRSIEQQRIKSSFPEE